MSVKPSLRSLRAFEFLGGSQFLSCLCAALFSGTLLHGQIEFESKPISYQSTVASGPVAKLKMKIESGVSKLEYDTEHGYLRSLLEHLDIPISSQMLVFSKTSFQLRQISSRRPRAIYFNDDVYVGWVQGGDVLEISAADPQLGGVFYTLRQKPMERPELVRDQGRCTVCHASARTSGVPGHLVRSVYADRSGQPFYGSGTFTTDHRSPFKERWGGWYVSGTHGAMQHMGNVTVTDRDHPEDLDLKQGANVTNLQPWLNTKPYLSSHSDIVALMVLVHQTRMHNLITRANYETRSAFHYDHVMNKAMDRPTDFQSELAKRRVRLAAERLVEYMLFADEFQLTAPIRGSSSFSTEFASRGPRDRHGRSLREFDLTTRMMKYPCSFLIDSKPFKELPAVVRSQVYQRLYAILTGEDESDRFHHLAAPDRQAILAILCDTQDDLPAYWTR